MKHLFYTFFIACLLAGSTNVRAQGGGNDEVRRALVTYFLAFEKANPDQVIEHFYPPQFKVLPKEQTKNMITMMFNTPNLGLKFENMRVLEYREEIKHNAIRFVPVVWDYDMVFTFGAGIPKENHAALVSRFKTQFGEDKVYYDEATGVCRCKAEQQLFAVLDPAYQGWKFIEMTDDLWTNDIIPREAMATFASKD